MKVIRKGWDKKSLLEYLKLQKFYDKNLSAEVLCQNEGCLFEVNVHECNISYELRKNSEGKMVPIPYFQIECPICLDKITLVESDFKKS